jgi:hypothetical protein
MEPSDPPCDRSVDLEVLVIQTRLTQGPPARVKDPPLPARIADLLCTDHAVEHGGEESKN